MGRLTKTTAQIEDALAKAATSYQKPTGGIPAGDLSPDVFLQGPKGDKGDTGATGPAGANGTNGVSVSSVKQTTTSTADGGSNVVTVTLSNGTTSTFTVKNGSKGSTGSNGTNGVSVSSVKQTTTSTADGGSNVVTVTLSNGTTSTFTVKNGSKGSTGSNGANGATFTPSVDANGNLSWTNNGGLANPATVNIKGPKGDAGSGSSGGGSAAYPIVEHGTGDTTFALTPNTLHRWGTVTSLSLTLASGAAGVVNEYMAEFFSGDTATALALPDNISWASDAAITIDANYLYQISILDNVAAFIKGKKMDYFYVKDTNTGITHGPFPYAVGDTVDSYVYQGSKGVISRQTGGLSIYVGNGFYGFLSSGKLESKTYTMSSASSGEPM